MNYLEQWAAGLLSSRTEPLTKAVRVNGTRNVHLGPRMEIARITLLIEPAEAFEANVATPRMSAKPDQARFIEWAIFGFLDIVMVAEQYPIRSIKITVVDTEIDPVSSSMMAFRHAGRDAGRKFLEMRHTPGKSAHTEREPEPGGEPGGGEPEPG